MAGRWCRTDFGLGPRLGDGRDGGGASVRRCAGFKGRRARLFPLALLGEAGGQRIGLAAPEVQPPVRWADGAAHATILAVFAFYCGTGWRASLAFFCAWAMGWERICVYDGGWCEWSRHAQQQPQPHGPRRPQRRLREGSAALCIARGVQPAVTPWPVPLRARLHPPA